MISPRFAKYLPVPTSRIRIRGLNSNDLNVGDTVEVRVERIVPRGLGIAFARGMTIFVPLSAPGDVVCARIVEIKGATAFAEIEAVIEPSPDRVVPPCEYFGTCGGCDFQQMKYAAQLEAKVAIIRDCLHRIAKVQYERGIPIIASPSEFGYRLRAQWHVDTATRSVGYYKRNSRELVDIRRCPKLVPELNDALGELRNEFPWKSDDHRVQLDAACGDGGNISLNGPGLGEPREIAVEAFGERFAFSARSFFQGNRFLIDKLVETAIGNAQGESALDLYCGVGLFTLPLARRFRTVTGVEENAEAVRSARKNAANASIRNAEFRVESVRSFLANHTGASMDFVLLDPPRFGTEKDTIMNLIRLRPKSVSYVACEPSVLARDLRRFDDNGYRIDSITAVDLFPQTHHVETVVHLSPKS